jgi:hypothetical protein
MVYLLRRWHLPFPAEGEGVAGALIPIARPGATPTPAAATPSASPVPATPVILPSSATPTS